MGQGLHSQDFIYFFSMNGPNKLYYYITLRWKKFAMDIHLSLLGTFVSYKQKRSLGIQPQIPMCFNRGPRIQKYIKMTKLIPILKYRPSNFTIFRDKTIPLVTFR